MENNKDSKGALIPKYNTSIRFLSKTKNYLIRVELDKYENEKYKDLNKENEIINNHKKRINKM